MPKKVCWQPSNRKDVGNLPIPLGVIYPLIFFAVSEPFHFWNGMHIDLAVRQKYNGERRKQK
jgi:hypothetical protein